MTGAVLVGTVAVVGVLHTLVPDHWAPIVVIARQRRWSVQRTALAGAIAGLGHVTSTLALGVVFWVAGSAAAAQYGRAVSISSALALVGFGLWTAYGGWKEARRQPGGDPQALAGRTSLLLILGSSPMVEGIPLFLAASTYGVPTLGAMAVVFAAATVTTYVVTCVAGIAGLRRFSLGRLERYGEFLSGVFVVLIGVYAFVTS